MKINNSPAKQNFSARLDSRTRKSIQDFDRIYKKNIEHKIDTAIQKSQLGDFCGDRATISFVETENPYCNIAPVISMDIRGITANHILNGSYKVCDEQDEEFLFEKMQRRPYGYIGTIENRLNSETLDQIKKALAIDYLKQSGISFNQDKINESTFDKIINSET